MYVWEGEILSCVIIVLYDMSHYSEDGFMENLMLIKARNTTDHTGCSNYRFCDIYDGRLYSQLLANQFSSQHGKCILLSFLLNTDRFTIFKSSNFSVWPIFKGCLQAAPILFSFQLPVCNAHLINMYNMHSYA